MDKKEDKVALSKGALETLEFLKKATNNGAVAVAMSNEELVEKTSTPLATIKRHLNRLITNGLIEAKTEFKYDLGKRCRLINVIPPKSKKESQSEPPTFEQYLEYLQTSKTRLERELRNVKRDEVERAIGQASFCALPGTAERELEAWELRYKFAKLDAINRQLETGDYCDLLPLGPNHLDYYFYDRMSLQGFEDDCMILAGLLSPEGDESQYSNPKYLKVLNNKLTEARYALSHFPQFQHGLELLPVMVDFDMDGRTGSIAVGVWEYMRLNKLPPFNKNTPDYHFEYVFNALRSLHVHNLTPELYYDVLGQVAKECADVKRANPKAQSEAHLRRANGLLAECLRMSVRAHEAHFPVSSSFSKDGVFKPILESEKYSFLAKNGLNMSETKYLSKISAVFNYNINNIINIYYRGTHSWHLGRGVYDLREFASKRSYGRLVPSSCLLFDFSGLSFKLSECHPQSLGDSPAASDKLINGLTLSQWAEFMWFDMAYRLFVAPEQLLFGDLRRLDRDLGNLEQWLASPFGFAPGIVKDLYSFYYPEEQYEFVAYQVIKAYSRGSQSGHKFLMAKVTKELTQICVERFSPWLFDRTEEDYLDKFYCQKKKRLEELVKRYSQRVFSFLHPAFGAMKVCGNNSYTADDLLRNTPRMFEDIRKMFSYMLPNEVTFMVLKHQAMSMLQDEHVGKWRAQLFGGSAAQYLDAIANRPEDKALWQTITRSFLNQEVTFHDL